MLQNMLAYRCSAVCLCTPHAYANAMLDRTAFIEFYFLPDSNVAAGHTDKRNACQQCAPHTLPHYARPPEHPLQRNACACRVDGKISVIYYVSAHSHTHLRSVHMGGGGLVSMPADMRSLRHAMCHAVSSCLTAQKRKEPVIRFSVSLRVSYFTIR